jgi:oligoribonuclease NrnB/cAMP/cGMP phosphodiesterase (DHH superfamily)
MSKIRVLYHASCFDGFCAAWVAWNHLTGDDIQFIPVQYSQPVPLDLEDAVVYILDFSYNKETMHRICDRARQVICLDHHKTAEAELENIETGQERTSFDNLTLVFDMTKSGARLTWEHFQNEAVPPWQVLYTEDRDLWKWELPGSREVNDGLRTYPFDFKIWNELYSDDVFEAGIILSRYLELIVEGAKENAVMINIPHCDVPVPVVNCTMRDVISDLAGQLAEETGVGGTYFVHGDGYYVYSLRSRGEIDVSAIAKMHDGGGHAKAAGFKSDVLL